ncbi:hypothetical protein ACFL04_01575 [Patescibacteria group bacterium]
MNQKGLANLLAVGLVLGVTVVLLSVVIVYQRNVDEQKQVEENINSLPKTVNSQHTNANTSTADTDTTVVVNTDITNTSLTNTSVTDLPDIDVYTDWQTHNGNNFAIQYPSGWSVNEEQVGANGILNATAFYIGNIDYQWNIIEYQNSEGFIDAHIADKLEGLTITKDNIEISGADALKATGSSIDGSVGDYILVFVELLDRVYVISNAALLEPNFEDFYNSFSFAG